LRLFACLEPGVRTGIKELHESYKTWCENSGLDPVTNACFGKELGRLGFEKIKNRTSNARRGIALKQGLTPCFDPIFRLRKSDSTTLIDVRLAPTSDAQADIS